MTRRALLIVPTMVLVLAGCGDAGDGAGDAGATAPAAIALEQWQRQLESVCARSDQQLAGVDPLDEDAWSAAVIAALEIRAEGVRSLPRPAGYGAEVDELLGYLDTVLSVNEESGAAAAIREFADPDSATSAGVDRLVAELGIEDCGAGDGAASLCERVRSDMVAGVLGEAPEPERQAQLGAEGCSWEVGDDRLAVQTGPIDVYPQALELFRAEGTPVAGIGDEAYVVAGYSSVTGGSLGGSTLWVVAGDDVYGVGARVAGEAVDEDTLRAIAAALLADG